MARIKDESVERVKAATEILPLVEDVVRLRKSGSTYKGLCPFHSGADAELHRLAGARHLQVLRLRRGRRRDHVRREDREPRLRRRDRAARAAVRRRARVRGDVARAGAEAPARRTAASAARACGRVLRARALGVGAGRGGARVPRVPRARRGGLPRVPARLRAGRRRGSPARALQEGYTQEELLAVGLANRRAATTTSRAASSSRSPTRAARVRGFQARKLHDDDPLQAKYVNSPEGDLFRKGDLLYGLDTARQAIASEDRAVVVEGNTDVLALRQAGFAPVVASMGTALTEAQLRELARLTKRLFLCFDADAAGQEATLRGMELAVSEGFAVNVVALPKGPTRPTIPAAFEGSSRGPVSYPVHRVRLLHARAPTAVRRSRRSKRSSARSRTRPSISTRAASQPTSSTCRPRRRRLSLRARGRALPASSRRACSTPAAARAERPRRRRRPRVTAAASSQQLGPEHFDDELHRRARAHLLGEERRRRRADSAARRAVRAARRGEITFDTASQLLLRLRERRLAAASSRLPTASDLVELQQALAKLRDEIRAFA